MSKSTIGYPPFNGVLKTPLKFQSDVNDWEISDDGTTLTIKRAGANVISIPFNALTDAIAITNTLMQLKNTIPRSNLGYSLGNLTNYWSSVFAQVLQLNGTASIDGSTAGILKLTGSLRTQSVEADVNNSYSLGVSNYFSNVRAIRHWLNASAYLDGATAGRINVVATDLQINGTSGATGTFTSDDGKTVTVTKGLITSIV